MRLTRFAIIAVQLLAVVAAVYVLHIEESQGLVALMPVLAVGFAVHAWLPLRWRLPFFALLGVGGACVILGPVEGALLTGAGLALIGLCHLPVPYWVRVGLVLLAAAALASLRAGWIETPWSAAVLPILGAMFMFRLIIYLYDLKHEQKPASPWARISYFFMLPNVCFPLFPVVDYKVFVRNYFNEDEHLIYQKGIRWMLLGVIHLVLYRAVYLYLVPAPSEIDGVGGVSLFAVSAYLQYLRISGQFHLIAGILCLFGFNLPATNAWYFFASSLTDMWRRINIYWKDFCQKIIYFPIFMRLRKRGATPAMVLATLAVFVLSWLLHSYQWFWIRGEFPIEGVDIAFWGTISVLVVATVLVEARRAARGAAAKPPHPVVAAFRRAAGTLAVFTVMCLLWSLWCSDSPRDWVQTMSGVGSSGAADWAILAAILAGLLIAGTAAALAAARGWLRSPKLGLESGAAVTFCAALVLVGGGAWAERLPAEEGDSIARRLAALTSPKLNLRDAEIRTLGYYEELLDGDRAGSGAIQGEMAGSVKAPEDWVDLGDSGLARKVHDYRGYVLKPRQHDVFKRAQFSTNEWGMRDKSYTKAKPAGVYRIALIGASPEMGSGVADGENYESLLEIRLNREPPRGAAMKYEILNFGVGGYGIVQAVARAEMQVFSFHPDAALLMVHSGGDMSVTLRQFGKWADRKIRLPDGLQAIVGETDVSGGLSNKIVIDRLQPHFPKIVRWSYGRIAELCREHGAIPIWGYLPLPKDFENRDGNATIPELVAWAREAGFHTIDVANAFDGMDPKQLMVAPWDNHPNLKGNRILADRLYEALVARPDLLGIQRNAGAHPPDGGRSTGEEQ